MTESIRKQLSLWLLCGVIMIYFQIILGGITRLTGSGLSITKWEIITGTIPPLTSDAWNQEFDKYKATPQYQKLNEGMTLSEFRFIYFWEYLHRVWARAMGFVFVIPFAIFLYQKKLSARLVRKLITLILLASLVASFGWIMVMSGLINRPWVDAYKLTMHLSLALITYGYCLWLCLEVFYDHYSIKKTALVNFSFWLLTILSFQLMLGGLMSGMKAGLLYPTFPDMNGSIIPDVLLSTSNWSFHSILHYDTSTFAPTLVQFTHRLTAYLFVILAIVFLFQARKAGLKNPLRRGASILLPMVLIQILLGILTVINFKGEVPVLLGILHQAVAILLLTVMLFNHFLLRRGITSYS